MGPHPNSSSSVFPPQQKALHKFILEIFVSLPLFLMLFLIFLPRANSLNFSFSRFKPSEPSIILRDDSSVSTVDGAGILELTENGRNFSVGRVSYYQPVTLWSLNNTTNTKQVTNFTTHFQFSISKDSERPGYSGDGITFFLVPFDDSTASAPLNSSGGCLGLITADKIGSCNTYSKYPFVAVEFDTFGNGWDPENTWDEPGNEHLGIDVNSVVSESTKLLPGYASMKTGATANAYISYDPCTANLSVLLGYNDTAHPVFSSLSYMIDLSSFLPSKVRVGFSAATGEDVETHEILTWDFYSTLLDSDNDTRSPEAAPSPSIITSQPANGQRGKSKNKVGIVAGIVSGVGVLMLVLTLFSCMCWLRIRPRHEQNYGMELGMDDHDFENGAGPRKFTYHELNRATNSFAKEGKLGEGGFGDVYLGILTDPSREIAVKKVKRESKQGKKEYVSEVKIISRLRHRNLVQLLGWCHDSGDLLLVYEFMPNGSLDSHLYGGKKVALSWALRYKIALGLASALLYLHEEWEQCVLHRDIKSSNVMLDSNFNAKLGDFGLARLVDHELGSQTTDLAGTLGYLAPECAFTGKASKESDVYSFGVVILEIACGRRPVEPGAEAHKVMMVEWVWNLYGKGLLLDAVDRRLVGEFDAQQMECLMVAGLWCCHPDYTFRPSAKQLLNVLNSQVPLPNLPSTFPVPVYLPAPTNMGASSVTLSSAFTGGNSITNSSSSS